MRKVVVAVKNICRITGRETQEEGMDQPRKRERYSSIVKP